jgi:hypothetical protein
VKRKAIALTFILTFLFSTVVGTQCINFASANPGFYVLPHDPQTLVFVVSPENSTTYNSDSINVNLTLDVSQWAVPMDGLFNPDYRFSSSAVCYLDSYSVWEKTVDSAQKFVFSVPLTGLSDGLHWVVVNATSNGTHYASEPKWGRSDAPVLGSSGVVYFAVDTIAPRLSILLENKTYFSNSINLNFTVSESASLVSYSLDGEENVTLSQNTLLTGLANGDHRVTVYAMDEAGNSASHTIFFTIAEPFPTVPVIVASVIAAVVIGSGLLVYFKKRKH